MTEPGAMPATLERAIDWKQGLAIALGVSS